MLRYPMRILFPVFRGYLLQIMNNFCVEEYGWPFRVSNISQEWEAKKGFGRVDVDLGSRRVPLAWISNLNEVESAVV